MDKDALSDAANKEMENEPGCSITPRQERLIVALVLVAFVALAIGFSLGPILEGPDEIEHYRFVRLLADTWQLPNRMTINHEYHQPPLYYALAALLKMNVVDPDFDEIEARRSQGGIVTARLRVSNWQVQPNNDTSAWFVHSRAEDFPYQSGTARAVHLIRFLSVLLGVGTVITCYGVFRLLWPDDPNRRLLGLGIVAFWPLFDYTSGFITNDTLIIFLSTLVLYLVVRQTRDTQTLRGAILLGVVLGGALLSKVSALVLAAPVGLAILLDWRRAWRLGMITLIVTLAVGGWWYVLGAIQYGDPTGLGVQYDIIAGVRVLPGEISFVESLARLGRIYRLLWARFGVVANVVVSPSIYVFFDMLALAGLFGMAVSGLRWLRHTWGHPVDPIRLRMVANIAMMGLAMLSAVYFFATTNWAGVSSARYLFPAIAVWAGSLAYGLDFWIPHRLKTPVTLIGLVALATVAAVCLLKYFLPAYRPLPLPPKIEYPLAIQYEDAVELIGVGETTIYAHPDELVSVTLYWRAIQPTERDLLTVIRVVGNKPPLLMNLPATGNLRSTEWQPGQTWTERWQIYIPPDAPPQTIYPVTVRLYDPAQRHQLEPASQVASHALIKIVILAH